MSAYRQAAPYYDAIYRAIGKDYAREAAELHRWIAEHRRSSGRRLLDVACGTGAHLEHLRSHYEVEGLDLDEDMLALARQRLPQVPLHVGDMTDFDLGRRFDVVTCLFSSIGYALTVERLRATLARLAAHLVPGGVAVVEPWLTPEVYQEGRPFADLVDEPDFKLARVNVSRRRDRVSVLDFHYLLATPEGVRHFTDHHELGMFTHDEYRQAFEDAGLEVVFEPGGPMGRGLYLGRAG